VGFSIVSNTLRIPCNQKVKSKEDALFIQTKAFWGGNLASSPYPLCDENGTSIEELNGIYIYIL